jgi:hypothetical protein
MTHKPSSRQEKSGKFTLSDADIVSRSSLRRSVAGAGADADKAAQRDDPGRDSQSSKQASSGAKTD